MQKKYKIINYTLVLFLIISLCFNFYLYKEKQHFMAQVGAENQLTVRKTMNKLNETSVDFWVSRLQKEKGDVYLERHLGELRQLSKEFHRMSGEMSAIGMLIDDIINSYSGLMNKKHGEEVEGYKKEIEEKSKLINRILTQIDSHLGENEKLWYKELSGFQTETQKDVWEEFKE
ncbi:hypothetical protein LC040_06415 [Bacillus tianshenii]|nr:hypothetical protein LC040_06415 [Bacillus tianshenii]